MSLESTLSSTTLETSRVDPEIAKKDVRQLYRTLVDQGQFFTQNPNLLNYEEVVKVSDPTSGSIMVLSGTDSEGSASQLSVFYDNQNNIVGYGGALQEQEGTIQLSLRIFREHRPKTDASKIIDNFITVSLASSQENVSRLRIPSSQLYNPAIDLEHSAAPLLYRRKGFSSDSSKTGTEEIQAAKNSDRDVFLGDLSNEDLFLNVADTKYEEDARSLRQSLNLVL